MKKFFTYVVKSCFTDKDWDPDLTKIIGFAIIVAGVTGWFLGNDPTVVLGFGAVLAGSGKFSAQG